MLNIIMKTCLEFTFFYKSNFGNKKTPTKQTNKKKKQEHTYNDKYLKEYIIFTFKYFPLISFSFLLFNNEYRLFSNKFE